MKKIYLLFTVLILTFLISIPKVYALNPMPTGYFRSNNALTMVSNSQTSNGSIIRYQTDPSYIYNTILATNYLYESIMVVLSDEDLTTDFAYFLNNEVSYVDAYESLIVSYGIAEFETIIFADYSDDDLRTKLIFPLTKKGGQDYVYVYTTELINYATANLFYISNVSYNQYMEYLMFSNERYQSGYNNGYQIGYNKSITDNYQPTYNLGYNNGYNEGYDIGKLENYSAWNDIMNGFFGPFNILNFELLPGFKIGYVFAFFMIIGVLSFLIGKRKN